MTAYQFIRPPSLSAEVAQRRAARKKVIEAARRLEHDSYKAMMQRKRRLRARNELATIV
jgi:hypothetical protein